MKKTNAMKIAFCGITAGLCTAVMLMGYLFPFATYVCPAMASVLLFPIAYEYGAKTSFTVYLAVSFLSFLPLIIAASQYESMLPPSNLKPSAP